MEVTSRKYELQVWRVDQPADVPRVDGRGLYALVLVRTGAKMKLTTLGYVFGTPPKTTTPVYPTPALAFQAWKDQG